MLWRLQYLGTTFGCDCQSPLAITDPLTALRAAAVHSGFSRARKSVKPVEAVSSESCASLFLTRENVEGNLLALSHAKDAVHGFVNAVKHAVLVDVEDYAVSAALVPGCDEMSAGG
jgi:hypothetical protein